MFKIRFGKLRSSNKFFRDSYSIINISKFSNNISSIKFNFNKYSNNNCRCKQDMIN